MLSRRYVAMWILTLISIAFYITVVPAEECRLGNSDLVIILDGSRSISADNFKKMLDFTKDLLRNADIDSGAVRVGILTFSAKVEIMFHLNQYQTKEDVFEAIDNIQHPRGMRTYTAYALRTMHNQMFTPSKGDRLDIDNTCIVLTDGRSSSWRAIPAAQVARDKNIHIYAVGIGQSDTRELDGIASVPAIDNSFHVQNFDELKGLDKKIFSAICPVRNLTTEDDFEYMYSEESKPVHDINDTDEWPEGSYTLLMSKYGCPRGRWNRGYISFTWRTPHVMLSHTRMHHCDNYNTTDEKECHRLFSKKTWLKSHSNMFGPFSKFKMTLNFCQRINKVETENTMRKSTWPQAHISFFGTYSDCPQGFHGKYRKLTLPPVDAWTDNGFLPNFTVKTDQNETIFKLMECVRDEPINLNAEQVFGTNHSTFILLKHEEYPCPELARCINYTEIISIAALNRSSPYMSRLFQLCYYECADQAYSINPDKYLMWRGLIMRDDTDLLAENIEDGMIYKEYTSYCFKSTRCWAIIDLEKSLVIHHVKFSHVTSESVQAGNDKWHLLRYGGVEIHGPVPNGYVGRYILIITRRLYHWVKVAVYVQRTNTMCMADLGMADSSITRDQISSSDNNSQNLDSVRAYNSGWCANSRDPNPYIQVDLLVSTGVDGITLHNWLTDEIKIINVLYTRTYILKGTRAFTVLYSSDGNLFNAYNDMGFRIDQFRPSDEPQTFIFYKQIITRYLRIVLVEPMTHGHSCIRFELHGCRHDGTVSFASDGWNITRANTGIIDGPPLWHQPGGNMSAVPLHGQIDTPILTCPFGDSSTMTGALQILTSPSQLTSVGHPISYRDGTSYSWIVDFKNVGFIKLVFKRISLRNYQDKSFQSLFRCEDVLRIRSEAFHWIVPTSIDHKNLIIETGEKCLLVEFTTCLPHTPRKKDGNHFIALVGKAETPYCISDAPNGLQNSNAVCKSPTMILSTRSLQNIPTENYRQESWIIMVPKFTIRLTVTYFHILCQSGTVLKVKDKFSPRVTYTNCKQPPSILLSESERMVLIYSIGQNSSNHWMKEGFRAIYSSVKMHHQQQLNTLDPYNDENTVKGQSSLIYKACSVTFMKCYNIYTGTPVTWNDADVECWARQMKMVSIRSKEELFVVKYMLRTLKRNHTLATNVVDPNYYAHIGISRIVKEDRIQRFVWHDNSPVLFSAWNTDQPGISGDCVRMSFHLAILNKTWEVEDCNIHLARYFICEKPVDKLPSQELEDWIPSEYKGWLSTTVSGRTCQRWDSQTPHVHNQNSSDYFPDNTVSDAANYCRDPMEKGGLWCYTTDPELQWEYCKLKDTVSDRCHTTLHPYPGTWNVTRSGLTCQRWDSTYPHAPKPFPDTSFPEGNISKAENFCRDPLNEGFVWCYTTDPDVRWDVCFVRDNKLSTTEAPTYSMFTCPDGKQISTRTKCNGMVDCVGAQDEINCDYQVQKLLNRGTVTNEMGKRIHIQYICGSNETISFLAECDGVIDCIDGTDEKNCIWDKTECSKDEFQCGDGSCIHTSLMCDFIPHCTDFSDEHCDHPKCYSNEEFECKNGQCIPTEYRCNAFKECVDGSDEKTCDSCTNRAFHCDSTKCIPERLVCDGILDCSDGNDERTCEDAKYPTCKDRWINGWRRNGLFSLNGTIAECNFDNVQNDGRVSTIFYTEDHGTDSYTYDVTAINVDESTLASFLTDDVYDCYQTFIQRCTFAAQTVAAIDDRNFDKDYQHCRCVALTVVPYKLGEAYVHACDNKMQTMNESAMYIGYEIDGNRPRLVKQTTLNTDIEIKVGPITCKNDLVNDVTTLPCDEDGIMYPASRRCIYDTDNAGYILGCRSGSHLQDCSDFSCPDGTVKCPRSFCVQVHHICDGISQCPDSADELGCGCNNDDLELILLVNSEDFRTSYLKLRQIAGQFNTPGAIVRIVRYDVKYEGHIELELKKLIIDDIDVNYKMAIRREYGCFHRLLASEYIGRVRFTTNATSRGIIFLQNGTESESVAKHIFQNMSKPDFYVYRVVMKSSSYFENEFNYVTDIAVNRLDILSSIGSKLFPSLCKDPSSVLCQDNYKCSSSQLCITLDKVCDGYAHCPFFDDEMFCDFVCPSTCSCSGYSVYCSSGHFDNSTDFSKGMDRRLRVLDLSTNIHAGEYFNTRKNIELKFPHMVRLNLSECNIKQLGSNYFTGLPNLRSLDLGRNEISRIPRETFNGLTKLHYLNLSGNKGFMTYESFAFTGLKSLRELFIMDSDIASILSKTFSGLDLVTLHVYHNQILNISNNAFSELTVDKLIIESNTITTFDKGLFNGILKLTSLKTSSYTFCCIRPNYLPESSCLPERDEFSSCDDLMRNSALQTMLWLMGITALFGNILAIVYRIVYDRQRLKLGFGIFVTNLAVADLFMGIYLLMIAIADAAFRKRYIFMDEYWRNSVWCTLAGVLSTISSEASVLFLCLITLDRFIVIKYPYSRLRFTPERANVAALVAWILSISISVIPLIAKDHFQNKFYAKSAVCVALPLTRDQPPGWLYSVIVFIGVNFVTFIVIALGQLSIYLEIKNVSSKVKKNRGGKSKAKRRNELIIARNLLLVVATDFFCWFPIGCLCMMAMNGYVIPGEVYAWVAVFVLPVNSALNPVLYTLTAVLGKKNQQADVSTSRQNNTGKQFMKKRDNQKLLSFFMHKTENVISVERIIQQKIEMTPDVLLKFTTQLTIFLHLLHKNSMALETLDTSSVLVTMEHGKITGDIQIRQQPQQRASLETKKDNMYQLGAIVERLMGYNTKQDLSHI